jgi:hypothetical protein
MSLHTSGHPALQIADLLWRSRDAFVAITASVVSRAVIGAPARLRTSTALLNSVPHLNQGLGFRREMAIPRTL